MPGPAPKAGARRRNARPDWRTLPASGRPGRAPAWPIGRPSRSETALWRQLWATPQAFAWDDLGWTRIVARYCRLVLICEGPESSAALLSEVRQLEDRLGLTPMSMRRLQWEIGDVAATSSKGPKATVTQIDEYRQLYA
jgi:hypothetical protein